MSGEKMLNRLFPIIRLRRRLRNQRIRFLAALFCAVLIITSLFFYLSAVAPRYLLTIGDSFTILTPKGFKLGQFYSFNIIDRKSRTIDAEASDQLKELTLPRPDNRTIVFKYPEVVTLGRPTYLGNDIVQSVDFTIKEPPANGLIQIWVLSTSLDDFLETSKNSSNLEFINFESKKENKGDLSYVVWDYAFKSEKGIIRGLEAFFDDKPYMYRISIFTSDSKYNGSFKTIFYEMVRSVTVN